MSNPILDPASYPRIPKELLRHSRVVSDRLAALAFWPRNAVIAEVGVALGDYSEAIISACEPRRFLAIDRFDLHHLPELWGTPTREHFGGRTHGEYYRDRFAIELERDQVEMLEGDSATVISGLPNLSIDLFYVDADHTYEGVRRDLEAILPKVKPGGWIVVNDYVPADIAGNNEPYGVIKATNEFMAAHGWEMDYFALAYLMYCDVGLRKSIASNFTPAIELQAAVPATTMTAADRQTRNPASDSEVQRLRVHLAGLEDALATIRRSTSWRITAPLRAIARVCGRP